MSSGATTVSASSLRGVATTPTIALTDLMRKLVVSAIFDKLFAA
jgi:hypothetical protein